MPLTETLEYHYTDHLGSVTSRFDSSQVLESLSYDTWGKSSSSYAQYTGKYLDDTGLYYFNARYYDPEVGRFLSEDPSKQGSGWFTYTGNNPLNAIDPDGRFTFIRDVSDRDDDSDSNDDSDDRNFFQRIGDSIRNHIDEQSALAAAGRSIGATARQLRTLPDDIVDSFIEAGRVLQSDEVKQGLYDAAVAASVVPYVGEPIDAGITTVDILRGSLPEGVTTSQAMFSMFVPGPFNTGTMKMINNIDAAVPIQNTVPGVLTRNEFQEIQNISDRYGEVLDVVGSRARGEGRNIDNIELPIGKDPMSRSDIDFRYRKSAMNPSLEDAMKELSNNAGQASFDIDIYGNIGPAVRFRPNRNPLYITDQQEIIPLVFDF